MLSKEFRTQGAAQMTSGKHTTSLTYVLGKNGLPHWRKTKAQVELEGTRSLSFISSSLICQLMSCVLLQYLELYKYTFWDACGENLSAHDASHPWRPAFAKCCLCSFCLLLFGKMPLFFLIFINVIDSQAV